MKKKIFDIVLFTGMSLCMMACAGKETSTEVPTSIPTATPTIAVATVTPNVEPTEEPAATPTPEPTSTPTPEPTAAPTAEPTAAPTAEPTAAPTAEPTAAPTPEPTAAPTAEPTAAPTAEPTAVPTTEPTAAPTAEPTVTPTPEPTATPTPKPTATPTPEPTATPTPEPTATPTPEPTSTPTPKPTATPTPLPTSTPTPTPEPEDMRKISDVKMYSGKTVEAVQAKQGDMVLFGAYEQDGNTENGLEWIAWKVLEKKENRLLLLSVNVLEAKAYHEQATGITWEKSNLYQWLQADFCDAAFSEKEFKKLRNTTEGNVFLLSLEEVQHYFSVEKSGLHLQKVSDERLAADATEYAKTQDIWTIDGKACWWLRSEGEVPGTAVEITEDGSIYRLGTELNYSYNGVRPAIWLELE